MSSNRLRYSSNNNREQTKTEMKEKNWDQRFFLYKIHPYDAFKDSNYLSLGLMKSKIKYERYLEDLEKEKIKKLRGKTPKYSEHYVIDSQSGFKTMKEKKKRKKLFLVQHLKKKIIKIIKMILLVLITTNSLD